MDGEDQSHWLMLPLEDVMEAIIDYRGKTPKKSTFGIPLITAKIVKAGRIETPTEFIAEELFDDWMVRGLPKTGDVVLTTEAPLGEVAQLSCDNVALAQRIVTLRGKSGVLDNDFLLYLLQSERVQQQLQARSSGSTVKGIKQSELRKILLPVPPLSQQVRIGKVLKALDDKIEINRAINRTLEAIAQAIFKSWFVDFDPVKAKMAARESGADPNRAAMAAISGKSDAELDAFHQEDPESYQRLHATAQAFPDALVESELGLIPEGWGNESAESVATVGIGKTPPRKESEWFSESPKDVKWVSIRDMGTSGTYMLDTSEYLTDAAVDKFNVRRIPDNSVLLSFKLTVGRVAITVGEMLSNEAIAHFVPKARSGLTTEYLYHYLKQFDYETLGSTSSIARAVNSKMIKGMSILVPSGGMVKAFQRVISESMTTIKSRQIESICLSGLRDTLLPKLLSGDVLVEGRPHG